MRITQFTNIVRLGQLFFRLPKVPNLKRRRYQRIVLAISRMRTAAVLLTSSLGIGTLGYVVIEGYPLFDAYYMSVITLATVGFGEIHPLSFWGRLFTSFLILFNIGLFTYAISTVTSLFAEGGYTKLMHDLDMIKRINALSEHTIVCGYGRHATEVCQELSKQLEKFVVIESNHDKIEYLTNETDYQYVEGDATDDDILYEAGIERATALVVTLPSDANNLFIVLSARQINPTLRIISRANNKEDETKLRRGGADHVVIPEQIGGFYMATLVKKPDLVEFFNLISNMGPSNVVFEEIAVDQLKERFKYKALGNSMLQEDCKVPIVAVRYANGQYELNPPATTHLQPDMHIVVLGNQEQMQRFRQIALES